MMFSRRQAILGSMALFAMPQTTPAMAALPVPSARQLMFRVMCGQRQLGTHILNFRPDGDRLTVDVAVDLMFKFGPVTLFRYVHRATETWQDGAVVGLESTTNDNGKKHRVSITPSDAGLVVVGSKAPRYVAPANARPATHWNRGQMYGPWINTQDGRLMRPQIRKLGVEPIATASGQTLRAMRYALTGDVTLDSWYDDALGWAGLSFKAEDGSAITYVRA